MNRVFLCVLTAWLVAGECIAGEIILQTVRGDVIVRSGATVQWTPARKGAILKPNDTIKTGRKGSAVLLIESTGKTGEKRVTIPPDVILDMSDVREIPQEELLLRITMERVRQAPPEHPDDPEKKLPNATVVHGEQRGSAEDGAEENRDQETMRVNGTKVLFDHRYFSTCALRMLDLMRWFPALKESFDHRLMLAESLERSDLNGEALTEYLEVATMQALTPQQHTIVQARIARLKGDS